MVLPETIMKATIELPNIHHSKWKINFSFRITHFGIKTVQYYYKNKQLPVSLSLNLVKVVSFGEGAYVLSI